MTVVGEWRGWGVYIKMWQIIQSHKTQTTQN